MSKDLIILAAIAGLAIFFFILFFLVYLKYWGIRLVFGNRTEDPPIVPWAPRAIRTHDNMVGSLAHFGIIVLVAHMLGITNTMTVNCVFIFFICRILHAIIFIAGIPWIRCFPYMIALGAEIVILAQIFLYWWAKN